MRVWVRVRVRVRVSNPNPNQFVLAAYARDHSAHPLVINTCGYATGLGAQLLADVLQAARPTLVVHLDKPPPARAGREQEPS